MRIARIGTLIAKELASLIKQGVWFPGDGLPSERALAERFGVSRASVREALRLLEARGLIESRQGGRAVVKETAAAVGQLLAERIQDVDLVYLFEFRLIIEPEAAALAAERASDENVTLLREILAQQERGLQDAHGFLILDMKLHNAIAKAAGNPVLLEIICALTAALRETRLRAIARTYNPVASLAGHRKIVEAIEAREPDRAREAMLLHLKEVEASALGAGPSQGGEG